MKLSRDELITKVKEYIGDRNDDETITLLEDISDSFTDDTENWQEKYETLDNAWREKYISRFTEPASKESENIIENNETIEKSTSFDELFKESEVE